MYLALVDAAAMTKELVGNYQIKRSSCILLFAFEFPSQKDLGYRPTISRRQAFTSKPWRRLKNVHTFGPRFFRSTLCSVGEMYFAAGVSNGISVPAGFRAYSSMIVI